MELKLETRVKIQLIVGFILFIDSLILLIWGLESDIQNAITLGLILFLITFLNCLSIIPEFFQLNSLKRDLLIIGGVVGAYAILIASLILFYGLPDNFIFLFSIGIIFCIIAIIATVFNILRQNDKTRFYDERYYRNFEKSLAIGGISALIIQVQLVVLESLIEEVIPAYSSFIVAFWTWGSVIALTQLYFKHRG